MVSSSFSSHLLYWILNVLFCLTLIPAQVYKESTNESDGMEMVIYGVIFCAIFGSICIIPSFTYLLLSESLKIFDPVVTAIEFMTLIPIMAYVIYPGFLINVAFTFCISYIVVLYFSISMLSYVISQHTSMKNLQKFW